MRTRGHGLPDPRYLPRLKRVRSPPRPGPWPDRRAAALVVAPPEHPTGQLSVRQQVAAVRSRSPPTFGRPRRTTSIITLPGPLPSLLTVRRAGRPPVAPPPSAWAGPGGSAPDPRAGFWGAWWRRCPIYPRSLLPGRPPPDGRTGPLGGRARPGR